MPTYGLWLSPLLRVLEGWIERAEGRKERVPKDVPHLSLLSGLLITGVGGFAAQHGPLTW